MRRGPWKTIKCKTCGCPFDICMSPSRAGSGRGKYCSRFCRASAPRLGKIKLTRKQVQDRYQEKHREEIRVKALEKSRAAGTRPKWSAEHIEKLKASLLKAWKNPEVRERHVISALAQYADPVKKKRHSDVMVSKRYRDLLSQIQRTKWTPERRRFMQRRWTAWWAQENLNKTFKEAVEYYEKQSKRSKGA